MSVVSRSSKPCSWSGPTKCILPDRAGAVALQAKVMGEGRDRGAELGGVVVDPRARRQHARHERGPRRRAEGAVGVGVLEDHALAPRAGRCSASSRRGGHRPGGTAPRAGRRPRSGCWGGRRAWAAAVGGGGTAGMFAISRPGTRARATQRVARTTCAEVRPAGGAGQEPSRRARDRAGRPVRRRARREAAVRSSVPNRSCRRVRRS